MQQVTAIFDIGKTNKKFILYDADYQEVFSTQRTFREIKDEDGFPCDNLPAILRWIKKTLKTVSENKKYKIQALNFSTYGASFVYVDKKGKVLTPLYNYLKPYPKKIHNAFHKKYGSPEKVAKETASPPSGMLNSGFQLFWLKKTRPDIFKKINYAFHFPQYLSYFFTGIAVSDYTSIGCHTSLWDFKKKDYHDWVYAEKIDEILPPVVAANTSINTRWGNQDMKIGVGIHDSSAALLPYFLSDATPFLLISTGTWSVSLNPFSREVLTQKDLASDCLNYMRIDGGAVKAVRLFLGKEYEVQVEKLCKFFKKEKEAHQKVKFSKAIFQKINQSNNNVFTFEEIHWKRKQPKTTQLDGFKSFEEAYHQLMIELVALQIVAIQRTIGKTKIRKIYIDGGFVNNKIFLALLANYFKPLKIYHTKSPIGSSLGAAMVITSQEVKSNFLKKHFGLVAQ
ncbi:MAG TPA: carbohydrate kinase [Phaeodactylibacter sp.]|nr:carbohydrate kinase [Phaeodactylibacter sp.]